MIELPEAIVLARQLNDSIAGKRVEQVVAGATPHKLAWYYGDPAEYDALLCGRVIGRTQPYGGRVEISTAGADGQSEVVLHFGDGVVLRYVGPEEARPAKHQLLVGFEDGSALIGTVAMYGGLWVFPAGAMSDNFYYTAAKEAVPPLTERFDYDYFLSLFDAKSTALSAKAFLATEQRIPGLGNGVLQDILLNAKVHPRTKMSSLSPAQRRQVYDSLKTTLAAMVADGGRDTERDLFGQPGGYQTMLSRNNIALTCPVCGGQVVKENYLGGAIYYCQTCQPRQ